MSVLQKLNEALAVERERDFIGRQAELRFVHDWMLQQDPPSHVVFVSGMGGIGKSSLILQFLDLARREQVSAVWIDGRSCCQTAVSFLETLSVSTVHSHRHHASGNTLLDESIALLSQSKTIFCIDNYEAMQHLDGWFRSVFLPQVSARGVLTVLAARQDLAADWKKSPFWKTRVRSMSLQLFSPLEASVFCHRRGVVDDITIRQLVSDTRGLPLAMSLVLEKTNINAASPEESLLSVGTMMTAELLREVAMPALQGALDVLCLVPQASLQELSGFLNTPLPADHLRNLCRLSFVRPTTGGIALHDVARKYLLEDFMRRDNAGYQKLFQKIVGQLAEKLKKAPPHEKRWIAPVILDTAHQIFDIPFVSTRVELMHLEPYREGDLPHLHSIMTEQGIYGISSEIDPKILDAVAGRFPESIRVLRASSGKPLGYSAGVLLYKDTVELLEEYMPGLLARVFPQEMDSLYLMQYEEAHTYYQLLTGVTPHAVDFTVSELSGTLIADMIMFRSMGVRFVIVTTYGATDEMLRRIGFVTNLLKDVPADHPLLGATIYQKDWRGFDVGENLLDMIQGAMRTPERDPGQSDLAAQISESDVKIALLCLHDPISLGQTMFAQKLHRSAEQLQEEIRRLVTDAPGYPMTRQSQELLRWIIAHPDTSADIGAEHFHMSRSTYYRMQKKALQDLTHKITVASLYDGDVRK